MSWMTFAQASGKTGLSQLHIHALAIHALIPAPYVHKGRVWVDVEGLLQWVGENSQWVQQLRGPVPAREGSSPMTEYLREVARNRKEAQL